MIRRNHINVLIACEESQAETEAFRELGFNAYSCDILHCRKKTNPGWHIVADVRPFLKGRSHFQTQDGKYHSIREWHLIIAHPPCTYLCKLSSVQLWKNGVIDNARLEKMKLGAEFFYECIEAQAPFVAVENPLPMKRAGLPPPTSFADPSWFGVKYTKKTLYWLRNLPPLMAEIEHANPKSFVKASRGKYRSRTFPAMAKAIAKQWGEFVYTELNKKKS